MVCATIKASDQPAHVTAQIFLLTYVSHPPLASESDMTKFSINRMKKVYITPQDLKKKRLRRWFLIDIGRALREIYQMGKARVMELKITKKRLFDHKQ